MVPLLLIVVFWSGNCAGKGRGRLYLQQEGVLLIWIMVGQGPTVIVVDADGVVMIFFLSPIISLIFLSLS